MLTHILEPDDYSRTAINTYRQLGEIITGVCDRDKKARVSILVTRLSHYLDGSFLDPYSTLVAIASPTTGLGHIDRKYCQARNIRIFSLQQHQDAIDRITSTSELTFGLILSLLRNIPAAHNRVVLDHEWHRDNFKSRQLSGLTLGLIGLGRIGGHVATYAKAFGVRVMACDPHVTDARFADLGVEKVELDDLCQSADIISLHASESEDNYHLIGQRETGLMKKDALLINTARGSLIDEAAVTHAIREQKLGGVACDVLENEMDQQFQRSSPLLEAAAEDFNVILTPHIGGCTVDAMHMTEEILAGAVYKELGSNHG